MRSKGTPLGSKDTPVGSKSTPMKSKGRTPIKPVTKYKEAGCQTSPGFVKRTRQSNGDSASKDEEGVYKRYYIQKVYLYMRIKNEGTGTYCKRQLAN